MYIEIENAPYIWSDTAELQQINLSTLLRPHCTLHLIWHCWGPTAPSSEPKEEENHFMHLL